MKFVFFKLLLIVTILNGFSKSDPTLTQSQIFKELSFILNRVNKGLPVNSASNLEADMLTLFQDSITEDKVDVIQISGSISPLEKKEQLVLVIPAGNNLPSKNTIWDQKYSVLLFYQLIANKWTLISANSFYNKIDTVTLNSGKSLIKVGLDKCINGKCEWITELYTINKTGHLIPTYLKKTFSDLIYISGLLLDSTSSENNIILSEFQGGDTLSFTLEDLKFKYPSNNVIEILEITSLATFEKYEKNKLHFKTYITKREFQLKNNKFLLEETSLIEVKNEIYP